MNRYVVYGTVMLAIACNQSEAPAAPTPELAPAVTPTSPAAPPSAAPAPAQPETHPPAPLEPCLFTQAEAIQALGTGYEAGKALPAIPGMPTAACKYEGKAGSLRVNVTAHSATQADAIRKSLTMGLAGGATAIEGDTDGAAFQMQTDMGTCALHYVHGNVQVEARLMSCREAEASARAKLLALPRRP